MTFRIAFAAAMSVGCAFPVSAQQNASGELGMVEVIGTREPVALPFTTDSVTGEQLAREHRDDLAQALETIPGIAIQNLGQRRERLILLRGFTSRQVPLFIDGIPVYVPYDGNVDLARFGVDYLSEVVVGKGLASLLYGPNILGGAINVVSRRPRDPMEAAARVAVELDDNSDLMQKRAAISLGGRSERWYASLNASGVDASGYRLPSNFVPVTAENGGRRENAQSEDTLLVLRLGLTPNATDEYGFTYYRQDGSKQDPPYAGSYLRTNSRPDGVQPRFWRWPFWDKQSLSLSSRTAVASQGTLRLRAYYDEFRNSLDSYDDATYTRQTRPFAFAGSKYDDYSVGGGADFEWGWSDVQLTRISGHYKRDVHREQQRSPVSPLQQLDTPTWDVGVEHEWILSRSFSLTPSYQYVVQPSGDVNVWGGGTFTNVSVAKETTDNAQLIATWRPVDGNALVAGVSRKTRFPTLKERFSGGLGSAVPNPDLSAEYATHYELAYERTADRWRAKAAVFQSDVRDAIESVTLPGSACNSPPCSQQRNIGRQRNRGVELSATLSPVEQLQLSAVADFLDRDNLNSPTLAVLNSPKRRFRLAADWAFLPQWNLRADGQYEAERFSNTTGTRVADSYGVVNAFVRFAPGDHWGFEAGARNLGDRLYAYEEGYFEAGRSFLLQVDWRH